MLFPTLYFAIFIAFVLPISWLTRKRVGAWKVFILAASYLFYGWWDWRFLGLIIFATVVNEVAAVGIHLNDDPTRKKWILRAILAVDLGLLGVFKYYGFFIGSLNDNIGLSLPLKELILPVGISFFTFQAISYVVDVYREQIKPVPLLDFAVYLAFFPQLVAGPIVRSTEFLPQLRTRRPPGRAEAGRAAVLIAQGLFKKVVISSYLADAIVDDVFATPGEHTGLEVLIGIYGYAIQIYADFSGYTDIAIGLALLLGFQFPLNFDRPYTSVSIQDFWRRWHMTLSRWLRDYLYFPLGGNRGGTLLTYRNLIIVMTLGGLWHGASGTFVAWGVFHGLGLAIERFVSELRGETDAPVESADIRIQEIAALHAGTKLEPWRPDPTSPVPFSPLQVRKLWLGRIVTFHFVCVGWVLFRSESLGEAGSLLARVVSGFSLSAPAVTPLLLGTIVVALAVQFIPPIYARQGHAVVSRLSPTVQGLAMGVWIALVVALGPEGIAPFIYFQF